MRPAGISPGDLDRCRQLLCSALPRQVELVELAPLAPLGTHAAVATVDQHKVVTTMRGTEVAADPTNGLALEAAVRRGALTEEQRRAADWVRLGAFQRVVRAQAFDGPALFAHFLLFGLVTAGRSTGGRRFEAAALTEHCRFHVDALQAAGADAVEVRLTDFTGQSQQISDAVRATLADTPATSIVDDPDRRSGRGYYDGFCFKVFAHYKGERFEVSDGGAVDWTQRLLQNRKERLVISGAGIERLVSLGLGPDARSAGDA
ncbi:hypothetical protein G1H11_23195 [Phytoactinopolyspora alkaliphila]|uniref:Uncharacterized protein n=1 Tax=Phytoactinopolyspora alkaliphila TaxID=1783498 RepID=A0A6N9YT45_9ACTN|nr:hypothetical protein [Phytoactinopolyspora alkaliphila]